MFWCVAGEKEDQEKKAKKAQKQKAKAETSMKVYRSFYTSLIFYSQESAQSTVDS